MFLTALRIDIFIISGLTGNFGAGGDDVYLIRTDEYGDSLWTKTYGGTDDDVGFSVQQTNDGGYIICGSTWSFGTGGSDVYLIKTDANGNVITGIEEQSLSFNINAYPNPFSYFSTIVIPNLIPNESESLSITFFDVLGKRIELHHKRNAIGSGTEIKIERGNLSDGIYFYQLTNNHAVIGNGKLIAK